MQQAYSIRDTVCFQQMIVPMGSSLQSFFSFMPEADQNQNRSQFYWPSTYTRNFQHSKNRHRVVYMYIK